jgi:hypothetical protein
MRVIDVMGISSGVDVAGAETIGRNALVQFPDPTRFLPIRPESSPTDLKNPSFTAINQRNPAFSSGFLAQSSNSIVPAAATR